MSDWTEARPSIGVWGESLKKVIERLSHIFRMIAEVQSCKCQVKYRGEVGGGGVCKKK